MPNFPYSFYNLVDGAAGELLAPIGAADVALTVKSGQGVKFPTTDFMVKVESEVIHVATRTVDVFSGLTRGYDGATAATHAINAVVYQAAGRTLFQRIYDNLTGHTHNKVDIPDFSHNHAQGDITNLTTDLAGKAPSAHNHDLAYEALGAVALHAGAADPHPTYLTAAEGNTAYATAAHNHTGVYELANANIQAHVISAHAPANAQANADITKAEIEAKLTGVISTHSHSGGGSDPWTYLTLAADFTTSSATAVDVTGLAFTPAANLRYEFEVSLRTRTATATVGPRPGLAWATGLSDGAATIKQPSSATAELTTNGNISAAMLCAVGGVPTTTGSWRATICGDVTAGAAPSGTIRVQLASETAGTVVTIKAGSYLKYRTY